MKQVTLAMLYGSKPPSLSALIAECQKQIRAVLGDSFQPYDLLQIHATLVDLARVPETSLSNFNLRRYRNQTKQMDVRGLLNFLRMGGKFPFHIQIGGFQNRDYPFVSQGQKPYERSFSLLENDHSIALLIGWPARREPPTIGENNISGFIQKEFIYPNVLDETRRAIQSFNILHKYHRNLTDVDNDFYMRIGLVHSSPSDHALLEQMETTVREYLSAIKPVILEITISDVYVVSYQDEALPLASTEAWPLNNSHITPEFIGSLYK